MKAILGKFMEIQMRQNNLLKDIAGKDNALQFWKASVELGTHGRDCHGRFWDPSIAVEEQKKLYRELELLHQQYKQGQKQLEELHKQLFAEVS